LDKRQPGKPSQQSSNPKRQCLNYQDIYAPNAPVLTLDKGNRRKRQQNDTILLSFFGSKKSKNDSIVPSPTRGKSPVSAKQANLPGGGDPVDTFGTCSELLALW
jgi:hypothetical protein